MRVAIDATVVMPGYKGAGRVVRNLVRVLPEAAPDWEFVTFAFPAGAPLLDGTSARLIVVSPRRGTSWEIRGLREEAARAGVDAVLTLREFVSFRYPPTLMHIAEPPHYRLGRASVRRPNWHTAKDVFLASAFRSSARRAAVVTSASVTTARWLEHRYGIVPRVIPPGIDPFFMERVTVDMDVSYFVHPATGDKRDNTRLVLEAFALSQLGREGVRLVLTGDPGRATPEIEADISRLGLTDSVDRAGWVPDLRLRELYAGAVALLHPSRYEGFAGLQPLEAMAQGIPAVVLDAPGVTDELKSAAVIVPHERSELMAASLRRLVNDVAFRSHVGEAGLALSRDYTWAKAAGRFVEVLGRLDTKA